jgi:hypothetical protein
MEYSDHEYVMCEICFDSFLDHDELINWVCSACHYEEEREYEDFLKSEEDA